MTNSTVRIEVSTSALMRLLAEVKPFAGTDDTLPSINCVAFEFAGTDLIAVATDRYTLAVSRMSVAQTVIQPKRAVRLAEIDRLEKAFRAPRGFDPTLILEFGEEGLAVETSATLDGQPTMRLAFPWAEQNFPTWRTLAAKETGPSAITGFSPQYLARFAKIQRDAEPVALHPAQPNKPMLATVGDHFMCFVMPIKLEGGAAQWTPADINVAPAEPVKAARKPVAKKAPAKRAPRKAA